MQANVFAQYKPSHKLAVLPHNKPMQQPGFFNSQTAALAAKVIRSLSGCRPQADVPNLYQQKANGLMSLLWFAFCCHAIRVLCSVSHDLQLRQPAFMQGFDWDATKLNVASIHVITPRSRFHFASTSNGFHSVSLSHSP